MTLLPRVMLAVILIFGGSAFFFVYRESDAIKRRYREATEEPLVDITYSLAAMLAEFVSPDGKVDTTPLVGLTNTSELEFSAQIYRLTKTGVDLRILVFDNRGDLLFDSQGLAAKGTSFAAWRDVALALRGEYGSRSTQEPNMPCSTMYISGPIIKNRSVVGVVTAAKPNCASNIFIANTRSQVAIFAAIVFIGAMVAAGLALYFIIAPLRRLTSYVRAIRDGRRPRLPRLPRGELSILGGAIVEMRAAIDGAEAMDRYARAIAHELKSPLTAIQGSIEILSDADKPETRARFLQNIERECQRMNSLIENLVALNSLTVMREELTTESIFFPDLLDDVLVSLRPEIESRGIRVTCVKDSNHRENQEGGREAISLQVAGNNFWLREALLNIIRNAIEFVPHPGGEVAVSLVLDDAPAGQEYLKCTICDNGPGVPDWAIAKVFEQFFSLPRPHQSRRSSGLGLPVAKEVVERLGGRIQLKNRPEGGTMVTIWLRRG